MKPAWWKTTPPWLKAELGADYHLPGTRPVVKPSTGPRRRRLTFRDMDRVSPDYIIRKW